MGQVARAATIALLPLLGSVGVSSGRASEPDLGFEPFVVLGSSEEELPAPELIGATLETMQTGGGGCNSRTGHIHTITVLIGDPQQDVGYRMRADAAPLPSFGSSLAIAPNPDGRSIAYHFSTGTPEPGFEVPFVLEVQRVDVDGRESPWVPVTVERDTPDER